MSRKSRGISFCPGSSWRARRPCTSCRDGVVAVYGKDELTVCACARTRRKGSGTHAHAHAHGLPLQGSGWGRRRKTGDCDGPACSPPDPASIHPISPAPATAPTHFARTASASRVPSSPPAQTAAPPACPRTHRARSGFCVKMCAAPNAPQTAVLSPLPASSSAMVPPQGVYDELCTARFDAHRPAHRSRTAMCIDAHRKLPPVARDTAPAHLQQGKLRVSSTDALEPPLPCRSPPVSPSSIAPVPLHIALITARCRPGRVVATPRRAKRECCWCLQAHDARRRSTATSARAVRDGAPAAKLQCRDAMAAASLRPSRAEEVRGRDHIMSISCRAHPVPRLPPRSSSAMRCPSCRARQTCQCRRLSSVACLCSGAPLLLLLVLHA